MSFRSKPREEWTRLFTSFLLRPAGLRQLKTLVETRKDHVGFSVNCQDLIEWDASVCFALLQHPKELLPLFDDALREAQEALLRSALAAAREDWAQRKAHARLTHVPPLPEHWKSNVSALRASDVGMLIQVAGTIVRTGSIKMLETSRTYQCCAAQCGATFNVYADREQGNILDTATQCGGTQRGGTPAGNSQDPGRKACASRRFVEVSRETADYQEVRLQEHVEQLAVGSIPRSIAVVLEDDLADQCKAGDDVVLVGFLMRRWQPCYRDVRCDVELVLCANSARISAASALGVASVQEEDRREFRAVWRRAHASPSPLEARDSFVESVCPQIYRRRTIKLALLLTLIGGVGSDEVGEDDSALPSRAETGSGERRRGTPHLLLVGDPGTGKSQFLRFASKLAPRCVLTTGCGTTSAGLTCSATKDDGEWVLEAGALVLADRGVCCIDEFSSIRVHDREKIHEAMEQQTLSVAKAGLVCKLSARATVIAVTNPKGKYDHSQDLSINTSLPPPLLSRFDIVLVIEDVPDDAWDRAVSSNVLNGALRAGEAPLPTTDKPQGVADRVLKRQKFLNPPRQWPMDKLRKYVAHVKDDLRPRLSHDAGTAIELYYALQRRQTGAARGRATIRMLESLVRVSQAHARLMFRKSAELQDAVIACILVDKSMMADSVFGASVDVIPETGDSDEYYEYQLSTVLAALSMEKPKPAGDTGD